MHLRLAIVAFAIAAPGLPAQSGDSVRTEILAPGVRHTRIVRFDSPETINVLTIDLRGSSGIELRHVRALDSLRGREKTSAMVARAEAAGTPVVAAVNADFFNLTSGENENNEVIDGEWWKGLAVTDSPSDSAATVHSQFALDSLGRPLIDQFIFDGVVLTSHDTIPLRALNAVPRTANGAALFTWRSGAPVLGDSVRTSVEVQLAPVGTRGDTLFFQRAPQAARDVILAGYESFALRVGMINARDTAKIVLRTQPRTRPLAMLVGGWPRLLRDGIDVTPDAARLEGTVGHIANARNPRTAIGFSRDSATLYLVTVDGRSKTSAGMTAAEIAAFMRELGAYQALNFDGGGSTTMVVRDRIVNTPSDSTGERTVGDALLVTAREPTVQSRGPFPALDSARLLHDIAVIAADSMEGRRIGTPGSARARAFLLAEFAHIGLTPAHDGLASSFGVSARVTTGMTGVNVIGMIPGTAHPDRYIVVSAHYDHLGVRNGVIYNGADDNASGAAALLAMARWFKAHPPENSMIFALFDGEEEGLLGAKAFVAHPPVPRASIVADVNLDMVSRNEKGELYASGSSVNPALKPLLDSIAKNSPVKLLLGHDTGMGESNWIQQSDQGAFASAKIPFVYFGVEDHPDYHKPGDKVGHIQPAFFYRSAQTIAEFVRRLDLEGTAGTKPETRR